MNTIWHKYPTVTHFHFFRDFFLSLFVAELCVVDGSGSSRSACPVDLMWSNSLLRDVNVCWHLWHDKQSAGSMPSADAALTWHQHQHNHSISITDNNCLTTISAVSVEQIQHGTHQLCWKSYLLIKCYSQRRNYRQQDSKWFGCVIYWKFSNVLCLLQIT